MTVVTRALVLTLRTKTVVAKVMLSCLFSCGEDDDFGVQGEGDEGIVDDADNGEES